MFKKLSKKIFCIIAIFIIGGLGGIIANRYFFPYLSATKLFSKYEFLRKSAENVTVINKTEQVFVKEDNSISKIANNASSSAVNIISIPSLENKNISTAVSAPKNSTGLIVTSDGLIMTYAPEIDPSKMKFKVLTFDGNSYDAEFSGLDSYSNLAFLKINASNLPTVSFGNSADTVPGEKVLTIGNSLASFGYLYQAGLLRSFNPAYNLAGKTVSSSEKLEGVFDTDFNAQASFTGGPAVDYAGKVIGVVGFLNRNNNIEYFQIPANKVKNVIDRAIKKELDQNPSLGIYYLPISKTLALANNLLSEKGALIYSPSGQSGLAIIAGSPAQKAGLQINDIIISINSQEINSQNTLSDVLYKSKKGDQIELQILRNGQEMKISAQL
jgi:serine protease Do